MSFGLEQLTIMTFGTSKYAVNKVKLYCIYLEVYFNILCLSICSVWRSAGALALTGPNLKQEQIQTHMIGWENNERGKINLADRDTDIQKVLGWKQKSFEIQSWLKDLPSSLRQTWMLLLSWSPSSVFGLEVHAQASHQWQKQCCALLRAPAGQAAKLQWVHVRQQPNLLMPMTSSPETSLDKYVPLKLSLQPTCQ